jgi:O-antigen/teichoic acid export membrane protein
VRSFDKDLAKQLLKYSLPLVPTTIFWWITNVSDRFMVTYFCGEGINGIYTAAYKIPTLIILVTGVFSEAWQFSAVKESDKSEREAFYTTVFKYFKAVVFVIGAFVVAFSQIIASILYAKEYFSAWNHIPVLVGSSIFSALVNFLASVYMVKKKSVNSFLTAMLGALVNIALNFVLIPESLDLFGTSIPLAGWGAQGAAVATLVSYVVVFFVRAFDSRKFLKFDFGIVNIALNSLILSAQAVIMLFAQNTVILIVGQAVCIAGIIAVNAKPLINAFGSLVRGLLKRKKS